MASIFSILKSTGLPVAYGRFTESKSPPFLIYLGNGQNTVLADDEIYHKKNRYQIEYYFTKKDESTEGRIETALTDAGMLYEKTEDIYISSEDIFVIYYNV